MAVTTKSLEQVVDVETPEQVVLSFTIAGVGSRAAAALVDTLVLTLLGLAFALTFGRIVSTLVGHATTDMAKAIVFAIWFLLVFAMFWAYYVLFEALWDGQTPGKRLIGLRVVRDGGYSITFGASAIRNVLRVIDIEPLGLYFVGLVSIIVSPSGKRLGDYAAGTIVVRERAITERAGASPPPPPSDGGHATANLTDDEFELLDRYVERRSSLDPNRALHFDADLADKFRAHAPATGGTDRQFLAQLHAAERAARQQGAAARSDTGAAREQHALVAQGSERWREFASQLARARAGGLGALHEGAVSEFVARYRELTTDLARLTTATRGRDTQSLWYLNRLVASGHALLYRDRPIAARSVWRFMMRSVPAEIRRSWRPIVLAAVLLYGPATIAYVAVERDPSIARTFIPAAMIDRAEQGIGRAQEGTGYIADNPNSRPLMSSFVMQNNITVTFYALAGGLTAGIFTVIALVSNGISLGGVLGLYQSKHILPLIVAFVAPHGVFELTAICIAGGAGFLLAAGLLLPGRLTRREALIANAQRAVRLIAGSTLLLICAGLIEGLISPIPWWSLYQKLAVSALSAVVLALYISLRDSGGADRAIT